MEKPLTRPERLPSAFARQMWPNSQTVHEEGGSLQGHLSNAVSGSQGKRKGWAAASANPSTAKRAIIIDFTQLRSHTDELTTSSDLRPA